MRGLSVITLVTVLVLSPFIYGDELFPLSIVHINDFHARFEETDRYGGDCDPKETCIGGYARTVFTVRQLLEEHKDFNPIYINAGDSFQGTLWYNVGRWNVTSQFLNILPADAMTLGNHEFDHSIDGLVPFLKTLNTTMLVANMDVSLEPEMNGLFQKSMIIERSGRKIGIIGVILETTYDLANTGKVIFSNESVAIIEEARILKEKGANIIIAISHCGYDVDKVIAAQAGGEVDVIIGSHSHTFLYTGTPPGPDYPRGEYPTIVNHTSGRQVLIVQASAYARYVGNIRVYFNEQGEVVDWVGAPHYMSADVPEDPEVVEALKPWREIIDSIGQKIVGETKVELVKSPCSSSECNLGNFFCDAMVHAFTTVAPYQNNLWTNASIGLVNTGALRVPLSRGNITYSHLVTMSPFENVITAFNLPGLRLKEALEYSVSNIDLENGVTSSSVFLQVSGLKINYNYRNPIGERVTSIKVRCMTCDIPKYEDFDENKIYRIVTPNFLQEGGDGYSMFKEYGTDLVGLMTDLEALLNYTAVTTPIYTGVEKRITVNY